MNQGTDWETISPDLTTGGKKGNVSYGTLTSLSESPLRFGLLYTGSDDGVLQMSPDGGNTWNRISDSFPKNLWVSRVVASAHSENRVYTALNGYRWDDFTPYLYISDDRGKTWKSISKGIPTAPVNAFVEDPVNENLLFVGTDNGLYASLDRGRTWNALQNGMPHVAVHDLVIQPEAKHLLVGTHGRSIYQADIAPLQQLQSGSLGEPLIVFELSDLKHSQRWGNSYSSWRTPNTPGLDIVFYSHKGGAARATIQTPDGIVLSETQLEADAGINVISYDVAFTKKGKADYLSKYKTRLVEAGNGKTYLPKGNYQVLIRHNGEKATEDFKIE